MSVGGVSKSDYADLIFIDSGGKVNEIYYCDVLLWQQLLRMLPAIRHFFGDLIIQQGHRVFNIIISQGSLTIPLQTEAYWVWQWRY